MTPTQKEEMRKKIEHLVNSIGSPSDYDAKQYFIKDILSLLEETDRKAREDELKKLSSNGYIAPDCPNDCVEPDKDNPRMQHWHHVIRKTIRQRLEQLQSPILTNGESDE